MWWHNRKEAARQDPAPRAGSCLAEDAADLEIREIEAKLRKDALQGRAIQLSIVAAAAAGMSLSLLIPGPAAHAVGSGASPEFALLIAAVMSPAMLAGVYTIMFRRRATSAAKLLDAQSKRAIGPLVGWLFASSDRGTLRRTIPALTRLLPTLEEFDGGLLTGAERKWLRVLLGFRGKQIVSAVFPGAYNTGIYPELQVAVLQALAKIGNADDLPVVRGYANASARDKGEIHQKAVAGECLAAIEARLAAATRAESLLRPAGAQDAGLELLRAGSETVQAPGELLRGAAGSGTAITALPLKRETAVLPVEDEIRNELGQQ